MVVELTECPQCGSPERRHDGKATIERVEVPYFRFMLTMPGAGIYYCFDRSPLEEMRRAWEITQQPPQDSPTA